MVEVRVREVEEGLVAHKLTLHPAHLQVPDLDRVVPRGRAHLETSEVTDSRNSSHLVTNYKATHQVVP